MLRILHSYTLKNKIIGMTLVVTMFMIFAVFSAIQFIMNISKLNISGAKQIVIGRRAIQAAKSGIEWGLVNILKNNSCFSPTSININQSGLKEMNLYVTCNVVSNKYEIYSQATYGTFGGNSYANKIITVKYSKAVIDNLYASKH